jgi:hypothetical protein
VQEVCSRSVWRPRVNAAPPEIVVLSNRADLISGGDALVEIKGPLDPAARASKSMSTVSTRIARSRSAPTVGYYGLITGLRNGDNVVRAVTPGGTPRSQSGIIRSAVRFLGAQVLPWTCNTNVESFTGACARRAMQCPDSLSVHVPDDRGQFADYDPVSAATGESGQRRRPTRASPFPTSCASNGER